MRTIILYDDLHGYYVKVGMISSDTATIQSIYSYYCYYNNGAFLHLFECENWREIIGAGFDWPVSLFIN